MRWPIRDIVRQPKYRHDLYRAPDRFGLTGLRPLKAALTVILIGSGLGGCSMMRSHDGPFAQMEGSDVTGSISPRAPAASLDPTDADLALARNAASDVLTRGSKDSSQPWENPAKIGRAHV